MEEMVGKLKKPRRVMMLVKAGSAVDTFIDKLVSRQKASRIGLVLPCHFCFYAWMGKRVWFMAYIYIYIYIYIPCLFRVWGSY